MKTSQGYWASDNQYILTKVMTTAVQEKLYFKQSGQQIAHCIDQGFTRRES